MPELFVYYRVAAARCDAARAAVHGLQTQLRERHAGLQTRLLRRLAETDGLQTWMEIYALPAHPDGVSQALQAEIEYAAARLGPTIEGPRHCEVFQPLFQPP